MAGQFTGCFQVESGGTHPRMLVFEVRLSFELTIHTVYMVFDCLDIDIEDFRYGRVGISFGEETLPLITEGVSLS